MSLMPSSQSMMPHKNNADADSKYRSIEKARQAASEAASQLESFLHQNICDSGFELTSDDDDCSIDGELQQLHKVEDDIRREIDGMELDVTGTMDFTHKILSKSSSPLTGDIEEDTSYISPVKQAPDTNDELPSLMMSPSSTASSGEGSVTPTRCNLSNRSSSRITYGGDCGSARRRALGSTTSNLDRHRVSNEGYEKFQQELEGLSISLQGAGSFVTSEAATAGTNAMAASNRLTTVFARGLFGKWEYTASTNLPLGRNKSCTIRTVQGTASAVLAATCLIFNFSGEAHPHHEWFIILQMGAVSLLIVGWILTFLPSSVDETAIAYICWAVTATRLLLQRGY